MAHHKSALKRIRQAEKNRIYNRQQKKTIKLALRSIRESDNFDEAQKQLVQTFQVLDKAVARGILHKNNAANKKSKLYKFVQKLKSEPESEN